MHRREVSEGFRDRGMISNLLKDKDDEELSFFRSIQKREKEQVASLLQPVSEEFEANGNYGLYRMECGGRKGAGFDSGKNDYNWLKTPPATPLFPSLEMETNAQQLVTQREIPIIQPLSRFAGNSQSTRTATNIPISPKSKPKLQQRHRTPNERPSISSSTENKNMKSPPIINQKTNEKIHPNLNFPSSNLSKSTGAIEKNSIGNKLKNRGISPSITRQTIPGLSDNAPPNLRTTNRPASATRGRSTNQNLPTPQKQDTNSNIRRQSCSPSVTRGRKVDSDNNGNAANRTNSSSFVVKAQQGGNRAQVLGSRMVDKFMNARISSGEDRQAKIKVNESSGFGRLMSKSSLDMAIKHMEFQKDSSSTRKHGVVQGIKS